MHRWRLAFLIAVLTATFVGSISAAAQTETADRLVLVEHDVSTFPALRFVLGVYDERRGPIRDLRSEELAVLVNGEPITASLTLAQEQRAPAVVIVADVNSTMADLATPGESRINALVSQAKRMLELLPPETAVSLVTFDTHAQVAVDWQAHNTRIFETLDELKHQGLPTYVPDAPYALSQAIGLGLAQFTQEDALLEHRPRALFVYAAGMPERQIDTNVLQQQVAALSPNPPAITVVALGSNIPEQFSQYAGNPDSLRQIGQTIPGGAFLPYYGVEQTALFAQRNALDLQSKQIADLENVYRVTFQADTLSPGAHRVDIEVHEQTVSSVIRPPLVAPRIRLQVPSTVLQDIVPLGVSVDYAQSSIESVTYYLGEQAIGTSTVGPSFVYDLDVNQVFSTSAVVTETVELVAVATDGAGQNGTSNRIQVRLQQASPEALSVPGAEAQNSGAAPIVILSLVLVLIAGAAGAGTMYLYNAKTRLEHNSRGMGQGRTLGSLGASMTPRERGGHDATIRVGADSPHSVANNTELVDGGLSVAIVSGDATASFPLVSGRPLVIGRGSGHDIPLTNKRVSRNHARIVWVPGGVEVTDLGSSNGTYVDESRRRLTPHESEVVPTGTILWIGPEVRLHIR